MKKIILTTIILAVMFIAGCQNTAVETPPWTNEQVEQMEDVETVPLAIWRF